MLQNLFSLHVHIKSNKSHNVKFKIAIYNNQSPLQKLTPFSHQTYRPQKKGICHFSYFTTLYSNFMHKIRKT